MTLIRTDDHADRIARSIRARAASAGIRISELADSIEMKRSSFYKRLDGEIAWRLPELAAVALRLGTPLEDIITDAPFRASEVPRDGTDPEIQGRRCTPVSPAQAPETLVA